MTLIELAEKRWLPDPLIRIGMRRLLRERLQQEETNAAGDYDDALDRFAERQRASVVTIETHRANEQHYEVPADFFRLVLGSRMKYSCGWWANGEASLDDAEDAMLELTCRRADIQNGMQILELGCGWGSLTLWMAKEYPNCQITALSNSLSQRRFIERRCQELSLTNVSVITDDVGTFQTEQRFDRVISVEMFEHVRNHENLLHRIASWLNDDGLLFVHIFCHRNLAYTFETDGDKDWMGRHFFSGGIMPAENLFLRYQDDLHVTQQWWINGWHYARTCEAWLEKQDNSIEAACEALAGGNNRDPTEIQSQRWRMFFMACAELFKFNDGNQWGVGHYVFQKPTSVN
jgi:cyclopropane-fatty-acyl-phospholipid synthase